MFSDILSGSQYAYSQLWVVWWSQWFALFVGWLCARLVLSSTPLEDFATAERKHYRKPSAARYLLWLFAEIVVVVADIPEVIGFAFGMNILAGLPVWAGVLLSFVATSLVLLLELGDFRLIEAAVALCIFALGLTLLISLTKSGMDAKQFIIGWLAPTFQGGQSVYDALSIIGSVVMPHNLYLQTGSLIAHHTAAFVALDVIEKVEQDATDEQNEESETSSSLNDITEAAENLPHDLESARSEPAKQHWASATKQCDNKLDILGSGMVTAGHCSQKNGFWRSAEPSEPAIEARTPVPLRDSSPIDHGPSASFCNEEIQPSIDVFVDSMETWNGDALCFEVSKETIGASDGALRTREEWQRPANACITQDHHNATRLNDEPLSNDLALSMDDARAIHLRSSLDALGKEDENCANSLSAKRLGQDNAGDRQQVATITDGCSACAPGSLPKIGPVILELVLPTCFAFFVNAATISIAAEHVYTQSSQETITLGLYNFCQYLPFEGACVLWGIILLVSGTASTVTTTLTGSYVMSGFLHMRIPMLLRAALARGLAIMPALIIAATSGPATVNAIIGVVNATLSIALPIVLVPLLRCSHERKPLHWFPHAAGWLFTAFIFGLNLFGLCAPQGGMFGLYTGPMSNFTWSVQANILQDLVIIGYVGVVAWLALA
jgi:Mn2+/Fe2+ NRAMP family transporter